jgi:hypothetical protein
MIEQSSLETLGFFIVRKAVHILENEQAYIRTIRTHRIFNGEHMNDKKRSQAFLDPRKISSLLLQISALVSVVCPRLVVREPVLLHSKAGCERQAAHMDYIPSTVAGLEDMEMPCSILVSLETDGTTLAVWPGTHRPSAHRVLERTISLQMGDVLIFRGDLIHAGSAYPERSNVRIHAYLDNPTVSRDHNRTFRIQIHGDLSMQRRIVNRMI